MQIIIIRKSKNHDRVINALKETTDILVFTAAFITLGKSILDIPLQPGFIEAFKDAVQINLL